MGTKRTQGLFATFILAFILLGWWFKPDVYDVDGNAIRFAALKGRWIIVHYWAEWCPSCLKELPTFYAFSQRHPDIVLLGVYFDPLAAEMIKEKAKTHQVGFPMLRTDPSKRWNVNAIPSVPATIIISPKGKLHAILFGPQTAHALEEAIYG